jgi:hypothetical protein
MTPEVLAAASHLFEPRAAYRFREITRPSTTYDDPTTGENPQYGASINYWLKAPAASAPTLTIHDAAGKLVRTLQGTNRTGVNRVYWDLEDEPSTQARLLTSPMYAAHIQVGPDGRPAQGASRLSILQAPGTYTVKLTVDGAEHTRSLEVRKDPNSAGTPVEIAEQNQLLYAIKGHLETAATAVHRIEALRIQLQTLARFTTDAEVRAAAGALETKLVAVEMELVDLRLTGQGQDGVRFESKLMGKLGYLAGGLSGADFRPTDQQVEVQGILHREVGQQLEALDALLGRDLADFNAMLRAKGLGIIVSSPR